MMLTRKILLLFIILSLMLLAGFYFRESINGYISFKKMCSQKFGFKIYEKLERDVVWQADNRFQALLISQFDQVKYVRYLNENDNKEYDLIYIGGDRKEFKSYEKKLHSSLFEAIYKQETDGEVFNSRLGFKSITDRFVRIEDGFILAEYHDFYFSFGEKYVPTNCSSDQAYFFKNIHLIFK